MSAFSRALSVSLVLSLSFLGACSSGGSGGAAPVGEAAAADFAGEWNITSTVESSTEPGRIGETDFDTITIQVDGLQARIDDRDGEIRGVIRGRVLELRRGDALQIELRIDQDDTLIGSGANSFELELGGRLVVLSETLKIRGERRKPGDPRIEELIPIGDPDPVLSLVEGEWSFQLVSSSQEGRQRLEAAGGEVLFATAVLRQNGQFVEVEFRDAKGNSLQRMVGELTGDSFRGEFDGPFDLIGGGGFSEDGTVFEGRFESGDLGACELTGRKT